MDKNCIHLDFETVSPVDLKKFGAYRYAQEARILLMSFAREEDDDDEPFLWDCLSRREENLWILEKAVKDGWRFYAHYAQFEHAISINSLLRDVGIKPPDLKNWFCTAAMCRRAGLPPSLEKAAQALKLPEHLWKDPKGKALIRHFCIPSASGFVDIFETGDFDELDKFAQFGEYCRQDVRVERAIHGLLRKFDFKSFGLVHDTWQLDKRINDRGIPVNVPALKEASRVTQTYQQRLAEKFKTLTGLNHTQRDKVLAWLQSKGYAYDNTRGVTIDKALGDENWYAPDLVEALELKKLLGFAAVKKIESMLGCACEDGRVRGTLLYHGAGTGRWSARLIQAQNFKRPTFKDTHHVIQLLEDGEGDWIETLWGNPLDAVASSIRHFIQLEGGEYMMDGDFSSVEARIVCWLAGQEDALKEYRAGIDRYVRMASIIFGKKESLIGSDERWMGKGAILGCGFGMGAKKFFEQTSENAETFKITGVAITPQLCKMTINLWRKRHSKVVKYWYACDDAVRSAITAPGRVIKVGQWTQFVCKPDEANGIMFLHTRLPSGRLISYPHPQISEAGDISYWGQLPMKTTWGRVKLYGGKIVENITQGVAADLMALGAMRAEEHGYLPFSLIHDQALAERADPALSTVEEFEEAMATVPPWGEGLPIEVEAKLSPFYTK